MNSLEMILHDKGSLQAEVRMQLKSSNTSLSVVAQVGPPFKIASRRAATPSSIVSPPLSKRRSDTPSAIGMSDSEGERRISGT